MFLRKEKPQKEEIDIEILRKQLEAVQNVSHALINPESLDRTLEIIVKELVTKLEYLYPSIYLLNPDNQTFSIRQVNVSKFFVGLAEKLANVSIYEVQFNMSEENLLTKAMKSGEIQISNSMYELLRPHINQASGTILQSAINVRDIIVAPIKIENKTIGCLAIAARHKTTKNEIAVVSTFADQISTAIYNSQLFKEKQEQIVSIENRNKDLSSLFNLTSQISKTLNPNEVAQTAVNSLPQDDFMVGAVLSFVNPAEKVIQVSAVTQSRLSEEASNILGGFDKYKTGIDDPATQANPAIIALKTGTAQHTTDLAAYLQPVIPAVLVDPLQKLLQVKSVSIYPLIVRNRTIGIATYFLKEKSYEELDENKKQILNTFTLQIGIALENANLFTQSQETQKNLESALTQLQEARRVERDMVDVMGHELRTPISIVRNALVMLQKQSQQGAPTKADLDKYLEMALESTRREITLIETLLSATKVDSARMQLYFEKVDFKDVVTDALEGQKHQLSEKNIQIDYTPPAEEIFVYADRTRIQEVMDNFLSNAVKYTQQGSVKIEMWHDENNGWIRIQDSGIGISAEDLQSLGKKFFRAKQYISGDASDGIQVVRPGGTGLGLYVTFDLIGVMNGQLYITSEIGKGSTFTFCMPIFKDQEPKQVDQTFDPQSRDKTHVFLGSQPEAGAVNKAG